MENENEKKSNQGPKFSSYWIYGVIALLLLAVNIFGFSDGKSEEIDPQRMRQMVQDTAIARLLIINEKIARIYIKPEKLKEDAYKDASEGGWSNNRYHYWMEIGNPAAFTN
ncbi:MAG: AAA family ATPase, partial [Saprospiraceae bacterium]